LTRRANQLHIVIVEKKQYEPVADTTAAGFFSFAVRSLARLRNDLRKSLTRRANHQHIVIVEMNSKGPRGAIRGGFFVLESPIGRRPARQDASTPASCVVAHAPPSEP
jgi:hypothetical protein